MCICMRKILPNRSRDEANPASGSVIEAAYGTDESNLNETGG